MNTFTGREMVIILIAIIAIGGVWFSLKSPVEDSDSGDNAKTEVNTGATTTTETKTTPVSSGATTPAQTPPPTSSTEVVSFATITYTNSGFSPATVSLRLAGGARFVNKSSSSMWVTAYAPTKETKTYPGLDQGKSVSKGGVFELNFGQPGVWWYQNLNNKAHTGVIIVIP